MKSQNRYHLELISFALCPYVQRSVIALKRKNATFEMTYIDLDHPPEWFDQISPLGQVPVLKVEDRETGVRDVLFESAVINEFVDEVVHPALHPKDPLARAKARAWIEYGSTLIMDQYQMSVETDEGVAEEKKRSFFESLARLEPILGEGPFFAGGDFSLVDAAYAPLFMRLEILLDLHESWDWKKMPRVAAWSQALLGVLEVQQSVRPDFKEEYLKYLKAVDSVWVQ